MIRWSQAFVAFLSAITLVSCVVEPEKGDYNFVVNVAPDGDVKIMIPLCLGVGIDSILFKDTATDAFVEFRAEPSLLQHRVLGISLNSETLAGESVGEGLVIVGGRSTGAELFDLVRAYVLIEPDVAADAWIGGGVLDDLDPGNYLLAGSVAAPEAVGEPVDERAASSFLAASCEDPT